MEVRRGKLRSGACGVGPAGNTLILSLRCRCGGEHSGPEPAVSGCCSGPAGSGEHCDLKLAVEVR